MKAREGTGREERLKKKGKVNVKQKRMTADSTGGSGYLRTEEKKKKVSARGEAGGQPGDGDGSTQSGSQPEGVEIHDSHAVRLPSDRAMSGPEMAEPAVGIPLTITIVHSSIWVPR